MDSQVITLSNGNLRNPHSSSSIINASELAHSTRQLVRQVNASLESTRCTVGRIDWKLVLMGCLLAWTCTVSMYDVYWSFKTAAVLAETEQNPLGSWLIALDGGDIALFMTAKALGNILVLLIIPAIYYFKQDWGMIIASAIAGLQTMLLWYLNFGQYLFPPQIH